MICSVHLSDNPLATARQFSHRPSTTNYLLTGEMLLGKWLYLLSALLSLALALTLSHHRSCGALHQMSFAIVDSSRERDLLDDIAHTICAEVCHALVEVLLQDAAALVWTPFL